MKKTLLSLLCALALLISIVPAALAAGPSVATASTDTGLDIVVLIDRSGTMPNTDPNEIALAATNMLIDRCDATSTSIAVIGYGYDTSLLDTGFVDLRDVNAMNALKGQVRACAAPKNEDTNTGGALKRAKQLIDQRKATHPNHSFAILVISDGKIEFGTSDGFKNRSDRKKSAKEMTAESQQDALDVANACSTEGIKISCLGIYPDERHKDKLGTDMETWTKITGGKYVTTMDVGSTLGIVRDLYIDFTGEENATATIGANGEFHIEAGASEANIEIRPGTPATNIKIEQKDENGNWFELVIDPINVRYDTAYTIVKMIRPAEGDYRITLRDGTQGQYNFDITYNRDLTMLLQGPRSAVRSRQETSAIVLVVTRKGMVYYDPAGSQPVLKITDASGRQQSVNMTWDPGQMEYTCTFTPDHSGSYTMRAELTLDGLDNASNTVSINAGSAVITPVSIGTIPFSGHAITKYDASHTPSAGYTPEVLNLKDYFSDPDGVGISGFEWEYDDDAQKQYVQIDPDPAAGTLTLTPLQATANAVGFKVRAVGVDGSRSDYATGSVTVVDEQADVMLNTTNPDYVALTTEDAGYEIKSLLPEKDDQGHEVIANLKGCFTEPNFRNDGEAFDVTVTEVTAALEYGDVAPEPRIEYRQEGDRLVVRGLKEGDTQLTVTATSYDGSTASFTFNVHVVNMLKQILLIAGAVLLGIILLTVLIIVIVQNNKPRFKKNAVLGVRLLNDGDEEEGSCILLKYGKGPARMTDLCVKCGISTSGIRKLLDGIRVFPRKSSSIELRYRVKGKNVTSVISHNDSKDIQLDEDGDRMLTLTYIEEGMDDYD